MSAFDLFRVFTGFQALEGGPNALASFRGQGESFILRIMCAMCAGYFIPDATCALHLRHRACDARIVNIRDGYFSSRAPLAPALLTFFDMAKRLSFFFDFYGRTWEASRQAAGIYRF